MDPYFAELGQIVVERWKKQNFSLERFPEIARLALEERPPAAQAQVGTLIQDFLLDDDQPRQSSSGFGQPELIVFDHPRFYIQVLFWLDGTTQIHQHEFSGAFHVLEGSSLHSVFEFQERQPISAHFQVGNLVLKEVELLETGATVAITSGQTCIHSLFHLETPSLTVVIRTQTDPGSSPQFTYLPPHFAVDPFVEDGLTTRRCQLLDVLEKVDDPAYSDLVLTMIEELDFERGFFILQNCYGHLQNLGRWEELLAAFRAKHGKLADLVGPTLREIVWRDSVVRLRSSIEEPEHRFFLALLLNVSGREQILSLVSERFPGPAEKTVLRWAEELADETGQSILDAEFPEELDIAPVDRRTHFLSAFRFFVNGAKGKVPVARKRLEAFRAAFETSSLRSLLPEQCDDVTTAVAGN